MIVTYLDRVIRNIVHIFVIFYIRRHIKHSNILSVTAYICKIFFGVCNVIEHITMIYQVF